MACSNQKVSSPPAVDNSNEETTTVSNSSETDDSVTQSAIKEGYTGSVNIVHINDIHGYVSESETAIGYARMAGFIDSLRTENSNTLVLDAGDVFQGSPQVGFDAGESVVNVLNTVGIDAMVPGNAEYTLAPDHLSKLRDALHYPMLVANMSYLDGTDFAKGSMIFTMDGGLQLVLLDLRLLLQIIRQFSLSF